MRQAPTALQEGYSDGEWISEFYKHDLPSQGILGTLLGG